MRLLFALLFSWAVGSARASDAASPPDFSRYPQAEAFKAYVQKQTSAVRHLQDKDILAITEFTNAGSVALEYHISAGWWYGERTNRWSLPREVAGSSIQVSSGSGPLPRLSEMQRRTLDSAIRELPPTNALPPIDELVIVSFHQGTNWVTHTYDKRNLPIPMRQIYEIRHSRPPTWVRSFTVQ